MTNKPKHSLVAHTDRNMLGYLAEAFDSESWNCPRCGHAEETKAMDSALFLREYLDVYKKSDAEVLRDEIRKLAFNINSLAREQAQKMVDNGTYSSKIVSLMGRVAELEKLSVTNIMIDVIPDFDGNSFEVYAKSVEDVEGVLTKLSCELEDYILGITVNSDITNKINGYVTKIVELEEDLSRFRYFQEEADEHIVIQGALATTDKLDERVALCVKACGNMSIGQLEYVADARSEGLFRYKKKHEAQIAEMEAKVSELILALSLCNFDASVFVKEDRYKNQEIVRNARKIVK